MFTQFTEQFTTAMKPFNSLVEINTKAVEQLINQQTAFIISVMNDNVAQTKTLATQTDFATAVEAQKSFVEGLQAKVTNSAKEAYAVVTSTTEQVGSLVKNSFADVATATTFSK